MPADPKEKELKQLQKLIEKHPSAAADMLLDRPFWHPGLKTDTLYERRSDDTEGLDSTVGVAFSRDADGWIEIKSKEVRKSWGDKDVSLPYTHRFRTYAGGGHSLRVRAALMILARAIQLDEQDRPDPPRAGPM